MPTQTLGAYLDEAIPSDRTFTLGEYIDTETDPGLTGVVSEIVKGVPRGAGTSAGMAVEGTGQILRDAPGILGALSQLSPTTRRISAAIDPDVKKFAENVYQHSLGSIDDALIATGRGISETTRRALPVTPGMEDSITRSVAEGFGSTAVSLGAGLAGGGVGTIAGAGAAMGYAGTYNEAKQIAKEHYRKAGKDDEEAEKLADEEARAYARINALVTGVTEPLGADRFALNILRRANKSSGGKIVAKILASSGENAVQEVIQEITPETARRMYDADRTLWDSVAEVGRSGLLGGTVGLLFSGIAATPAMVGAMQSRENFPAKESEGLVSDPIPEGPAVPGVITDTGVVPRSEWLEQKKALLADADSRAEAGQSDPVPTADAFRAAGETRGTRAEGSKRIEELRKEVADVEAQAETEAAAETGVLEEQAPAEPAPPPPAPPEPPVTPERVAEQPELGTTSIKNAVVDEERAKRGLPPAMQPARRAFDAVWDEAMRTVGQEPFRQDSLIAELKENPRAVTDLEDALLLHRQVELQNEYDKALERTRQAFADNDAAAIVDAENAESMLSGRLLELYDIDKAVGTATSRGLNARKMLVNEQFALARMMAQKRSAMGVAELSEADAKQVRELHQRIDELQKKYDALTAEKDELAARLEAEQAVQKAVAVTKTARKSRTVAAKDNLETAWKDFERIATGRLFSNPLDPELIASGVRLAKAYVDLGVATFQDFFDAVKARVGEERADRASDTLRRAWAQAESESRPQSPQELGDKAALHRYARELAEYYVERGIASLDALVDALHADLKQVVPGITRRQTMDVYSQYGEYTPPTENEIKRTLYDLRRQAQETAKIEDMQLGRPPKKTGKGRPDPSDESRRLSQLVNELKKLGGFVITDPVKQLRTALDSIKTRLHHQIADLNAQIETRQKTIKQRKGVPLDAEARTLVEQRDKLREQFEEIFGRPEMTEEQRLKLATAAVQRSITDYETRIKNKDVGPRQRLHTRPITEALQVLRDHRDALKAELKHLRDVADPKKTPEERALSALKKNLLRRTADYQDRLARGDFAVKERKKPPTDKEVESLRFKMEQAKIDYLKGLEADRRARRTVSEKIFDAGVEGLNLSRSILTSIDLTAVGRQGGAVVLGRPLMGAKAFKKMMEALASEEGMSRIMAEIAARNNALLYQQSGLDLTEIHGRLLKQEEVYMSRLSQSIPGVAASERAYVTFLNVLRADLFDSMIATLGKSGTATAAEMKAIANYINVATGRGDLGRFKAAAVPAATVFFSPRHALSRFQYLTLNPLRKAPTWRVRGMIAKEYGRMLVGLGLIYATAVAALTALLGPPGDDDGWGIETDPRSSDFMKIRIGRTRIDPLFGLSQVTVLLTRLAFGKTKRLSGEVVPIRGSDVPFGGSKGADVIARFMRTKLSPVFSSAIDLISGENVVGTPVTPTDAALNMVIPISVREIYESILEHGVPAGTAIGLLEILGWGTQTHTERYKEPKRLIIGSQNAR